MESTKKTSSNYFFYKSVLRKVSFNVVLFQKELNKAILALPEREGVRLYRWALFFSMEHPELQANQLYASF
ncbi:MAG: hypothetical protein CBC02_000275 [Flavobacteriaceae bacterium TMED42]|nr:MAG: hypothetical protein CBC02_000275 [Flavobacteriaceae bacterium TMED42]|tara:strand:+ start:538 stop:750 length:213 start_codon:yes stop_codon:yes gene_type:complete